MSDPSIPSRLKSLLQEHYDGVVKEPLPDHWVELIEKLREREREQAQPKHRGRSSRTG
jgi:Anti-sigma factor NepR